MNPNHCSFSIQGFFVEVGGLISKSCLISRDLQSVCVRLNWVHRAKKNLGGSSVVVACVVGFHEGTYSVSEKVKYEKIEYPRCERVNLRNTTEKLHKL